MISIKILVIYMESDKHKSLRIQSRVRLHHPNIEKIRTVWARALCTTHMRTCVCLKVFFFFLNKRVLESFKIFLHFSILFPNASIEKSHYMTSQLPFTDIFYRCQNTWAFRNRNDRAICFLTGHSV